MRNLHAFQPVVLFLLTCVCSIAAAQPKPVAVLHLDKGFIDDPLALSADGQRLYYVATDGATWAELRVIALPETRTVASVPQVPLEAVRLLPLPEERVLLVSRDPATGARSGTVYSLKGDGKEKPRRVGTASDIVLGTVKGEPAIVLFSRPEGKSKEYRVQAFHAGTLRPLGGKSFRVQGDEGQIAGADGLAMPLYFTDDYLTMAVKQAGEYDKKHDIRKPDRMSLLDMLSGKQRTERTIAEPAVLAELAQVRQRHPGESLFLDYDAGKQRLELLHEADGGDVRSEVKMPRKLALYDPATLCYQLSGGRLFVSLTVDPVNADAVARKKADPDQIDLCLLDPQAKETGAEARRLVELPGDKRPSTWVVAAARLALLRKHKGFSRGGTDLEVYDLEVR